MTADIEIRYWKMKKKKREKGFFSSEGSGNNPYYPTC